MYPATIGTHNAFYWWDRDHDTITVECSCGDFGFSVLMVDGSDQSAAIAHRAAEARHHRHTRDA